MDRRLDYETGVEPVAKPRSHTIPPDPHQASLFGDPPSAPIARHGDPATSAAAAVRAGRSLRRSQEAVLSCLRKHGPMTDEQLVAVYGRGAGLSGVWPEQSASGIRSRRAELVVAGLVAERGTATMSTGNKATVWGLTQAR